MLGEEDAEKRADARLHVGHKEVQGFERYSRCLRFGP
jgi:hypothetical protein